MDREILVVPRPTELPVSGVVPIDHQQFVEYLNERGRSHDRAQAEEDERFLQVIPYVVVVNRGLNPRRPFVLVGERLKGGNESRLHNRLTLGFGGHVKRRPGQAPYDDFVTALADELNEELGITDLLPTLGVQGLIVDSHDAVGRVHLGALMVLHVDGFNAVRCGEPDKLGLSWVQINLIERTELEPRLERWALISLRSADEFIY